MLADLKEVKAGLSNLRDEIAHLLDHSQASTNGVAQPKKPKEKTPTKKRRV